MGLNIAWWLVVLSSQPCQQSVSEYSGGFCSVLEPLVLANSWPIPLSHSSLSTLSHNLQYLRYRFLLSPKATGSFISVVGSAGLAVM